MLWVCLDLCFFLTFLRIGFYGIHYYYSPPFEEILLELVSNHLKPVSGWDVLSSQDSRQHDPLLYIFHMVFTREHGI